jgi:uncharacterized membrane protein YfcA
MRVTDEKVFAGIVGTAAVAALVFFGVPMAAESTTNSCLAVERAVVGSLADLDDGHAAAKTALQQFPDIPPFVGCSYMYWKATSR